MSTTVVCLSVDGEPVWAVCRDGRSYRLGCTLAELLALPVAEAWTLCAAALGDPDREIADAGRADFLPPVDLQEVWAAGVTYERSRRGRVEESGRADLYDAVYTADRPELFLKSTPQRVVTDGAEIGIRADSGWDVPEPELGLVLTSAGEVFGYLPANDVSSRSIEGDNALYLPQAKVYTASCALGTAIVPAREAGAGPFDITLTVIREGAEAYRGTASTSRLRRSFDELAGWLYRALDHPAGAVLLSGTGIVPGPEFALRAGDVVTVDIAGVGMLTNPVITVGSA